MARCAGAALLAAIEIYNKPVVEHREQTFAMLVPRPAIFDKYKN